MWSFGGLSRRNEMKTETMLHLKRRFYEAFCGTAAKYEAQLTLHEAALPPSPRLRRTRRAMKRSLDPSSSALQIPPRQAGFMFFLPIRAKKMVGIARFDKERSDEEREQRRPEVEQRKATHIKNHRHADPGRQDKQRK